MNRVLLAIGGLLVGLLATMFAAPALVDWNRYRGVLEEEATRFLGREVRVGGKVNLRLLPVPYVQFEQVRVADVRGSVGRPMFMADNFTVWLSVGALLSGGIEAKDIELRKPTVTLVLDDKGGGNWASLSPGNFRSSFVPAKVAFDSVRIADGTLAILAPDGTVKTKFEKIDGELSAQALEGPYRVNATYARGGANREFRFSTAPTADDGTVHFKGTVRDPGSGVSFGLEGDAREILTNLKVSGQVTARLPLPASLAGKAGSAPASATGGPAPGEFDLRAELEGNTRGFKLSDLSLSFEQEGRPQLATGAAQVSWGEQTDVAVTLRSNWLDLDRIAGAGTGGSPLELAQGVAGGVSGILATEGRTKATLAIDQATLGGDVVSNLTTVLEYANRQLNVTSLSAALPGGARLAAAGSFQGEAPDLRYAGRIVLRGASMARFSNWLAPGQKLALATRDGPFNMAGDVSLGAKEVSARNLTLEIGRNVLSGDASWSSGQSRRIMLNLAGSELDLSPFVAADVDPATALRQLGASLAGVKGSGSGTVAPGDADIKLRVDRMTVGAAPFRNVIADMKLANGHLALNLLKLSSPDGYDVDLKGDVTDLGKPEAKGVLTGLAVARTGEGVAALARFAGLPADLVSASQHEAAIVPLRLAGRFQVGDKGPDTHALAIDGELAGSRVAGTFRFGKQQSVWRDRPLDFAVTLDEGAARWLLARAVGATATLTAQAESNVKLVLRGMGSLEGGMTTLAALDADGIDGSYRGTVSLNDQGELGLEGDVALSLKDLASGLALAGLPGGAEIQGPVTGTVHVERRGDRLKLASPRLGFGGSNLSGELAFVTADGITRTSGEVKLDAASLPGLFALLSTRERRAAQADGPSPWSEAALDLSLVEKLAGSQVRLTVGKLAIAPGMPVINARLDATARADGLDVRMNDAAALGGHASAILTLSKAPAGVRMTMEGAIRGAQLEKVPQSPPNAPTAFGELTASLKVKSTALSARGLVVALSGSGEARISQARLTRWSPAAVSSAVDDVLAMKGELPAGELRAQLEKALRSQGVNVGSDRLSLTVADGVLRVEPLKVETPQGRLTGRASIDLDHLVVDAEWKVQGRATPSSLVPTQKAELPAVSVRFGGRLANFAAMQRRLDMDALDREFIVRKVELQVAELERLRKLDEQRANDEAKRQLAERLAAEQRRLEELKKQQQEAADKEAAGLPPVPLPEPPVAPVPLADPGQQTAPGDGASLGVDASGQAVPAPGRGERAPRAATPAKAGRRDPFVPLGHSSP